MEKPSREDWTRIVDRFMELKNYPNCVWAIAGKHVKIQCPPSAGATNYKNFRSVVLQAVVDADEKCIAVDAGEYGRSIDGDNFKESNFNALLVAGRLNLLNQRAISDESEYLPIVLLFDKAYPL
jgi:hypothetical protein